VITAWRLAAPDFADSAEQLLSGDGAALYGGRWNSPGVPAVYTSASLALAAMELLVHLSRPEVLHSYRKMPVYFPDSVVMHLQLVDLPEDWSMLSMAPPTQAIGDQWLQDQGSAVLQVPSVVVPQEYNFILNPLHADFAKITVGPVTDYAFDERLGKGSKTTGFD